MIRINTSYQWFQENLDIIFFIYGLTFLILGISILLQPKRGSEFKLGNILWLFVCYCLIHSPSDFISMWLFNRGSNETIYIFAQFLTYVSYIFLFEFGRRLLNLVNKNIDWRILPMIYFTIIVVSLLSNNFWITMDILIGYFVRFPAGVMAGVGFILYYNLKKERLVSLNVKIYFYSAGVSLLAWSFFCGIIRSKGDFFLANILNIESFFLLLSIPVYVFRSICALVITWSLIHILKIFDWETKNKIESALEEKERTRQKLIESEEIYKNERDNFINILNTMQEGVVIINQQYDIEFVNPRFKHEFGPTEGKKCYNYFLNRKEICHICKNNNLFKDKTIKREWYSNKTQTTYDIVTTTLKNPDGTISLLDIFHDISERKTVEQKLKDISKMKSDLIRRSSHELKTPLVSIKGNTELLLLIHYNRLDSDMISIIKEIQKGSERLEDLIKDLLNSSKLESGQVKLKPVKEDLAFLIKFCVGELASLAKIRKQKIYIKIHENLTTIFEKEKLYEVINNLLSNAIKYTPPSGIIKIKSEIKAEFFIISVEDNGIGITEEEKGQIFKQFGKIEHYGQGLDLGIEGSGLGLYISKKIVELHGGKIWVDSKGRNNGSTFSFSLPIIKDYDYIIS